MAATRKEELAKKAHLANLALQLNQQANPKNLNAISQTSSAYMELKNTEELRVTDQTVAKVITSDLAKADQVPNVTHRLVAAATIKPIVLPMPFSVVEDAKEKIALDDILPSDVLDLIVDYKPFAYDEAKKEEKPSNNTLANNLYKAPRASFFGKNLGVILHQAANDILNGNQAKVDRVVALVKNNPSYLLSPTEGRDRLGRRVQGTLLQIAAMAGDVNLRELKEEEKQHRGIVELLQEAGNLSKDNVAKQLHPVLFSEEAIKANEARNKRIQAAVEHFAEGIFQAEIAKEPAEWSVELFQAAQKKCALAINTFRATLQTTLNDVIVSGYVFDTSILHQAMTWFEQKNNLDRFGGWITLASDVFWVNGIGSLQCALSSRDAQVCHRGIIDVAQDRILPPRDFKTKYASSFSSSFVSYRPGLDSFISSHGFGFSMRQYETLREQATYGRWFATLAGQLISSKNSSAAKFMQRQDKKSASRCIIQ